MAKSIATFVLVMLVSFKASAQKSQFQDPLLDHLTGKWVLQGTIDAKQTTHDVQANGAVVRPDLSPLKPTRLRLGTAVRAAWSQDVSTPPRDAV